jgi:hypothetical protein
MDELGSAILQLAFVLSLIAGKIIKVLAARQYTCRNLTPVLYSPNV